MKKLFASILAITFAVSLTGCGAVNPYFGGLYTNVTYPAVDLEVESSSDAGMTKTGTGTCTTILGLIATGECSVEAAMKDGGLKKIHHVDQEYKQILGLFSTMTIKVYGE